MSWINKILPSGISRPDGEKRASVPEGVWTKCIKCDAVLYRPDLDRNANVCPKCEHHMRIGARRRLDLFLDVEDREEVFAEIEPIDRLKFRDKRKYIVRLAAAQKDTGERDALVTMRGKVHDIPVVCAAFEFRFHGGSMGQAVGEKFSRAAQLALSERIPLICFAASGGARMQEALISLMQMAKTSAVIERMHREGVPYISVLTDPVYGGVSASLAMLGDVNIAEPEARAGFAGPNIIEQTIRQKLPKGFQRSEFLLEHGAVDMIVPRGELRDTIARIIAKLGDLEAFVEDPADADDEAQDADGVAAEAAEGAVTAAAAAAASSAPEVDAELPQGDADREETEPEADSDSGTVDADEAVEVAGEAGAEDVSEDSEDNDADEQLRAESPETLQADSAEADAADEAPQDSDADSESDEDEDDKKADA